MVQNVRPYYVAWLLEADWPRWSTLCEDLPDTYQEWLESAAQPARAIGVHPSRIRRVEFGPDEYATWCHSRGRLFNAASRALYATFLGKARDSAGGK
jgi:hypothetical protein